MKLFIILSLMLGSVCVTAQTDPAYIDVRSWAEYQLDHIEGDIRITSSEIVPEVQSQFPDKSTPIRLYCAVGGRASRAAEALRAVGYTNVQGVGGIDDVRKLRQLPGD
jgi:phage shock protein E